MSIETSINNLKSRIANAYTAAEAKGATLPVTQNSANLANCISSIELTDWASLGNELLRAEAYSKTVDTSNQFVFIGRDNQYQIVNASSVSFIGGYCWVIDGNIYHYNPTTNVLTQRTTSNTMVKGLGNGYLIKTDGYLYYFSDTSNSTTISDSASSFYQIMGVGVDGVNKVVKDCFIYDGKLYKSYKTSSGNRYALIDANGIWSEWTGTLGIRDNLLFRYDGTIVTQVSTSVISMLKSAITNTNQAYIVYEASPNILRRCSISSGNPGIFKTYSSDIVKIFTINNSTVDPYVLCQDGNIYAANAPSTPVTNPFIDAYRNTYVYESSIKNYYSTISNISGASVVTEDSSFYVSCVRLTPNSTHTYVRYGTSNATKSYATVTGTDPQNTTLSGNTMTYDNMILTRDNSRDGTFTFYPEDLKNKTWTDYEMVTNAINASLHQNIS